MSSHCCFSIYIYARVYVYVYLVVLRLMYTYAHKRGFIMHTAAAVAVV